jgi:hypothetical protein
MNCESVRRRLPSNACLLRAPVGKARQNRAFQKILQVRIVNVLHGGAVVYLPHRGCRVGSAASWDFCLQQTLRKDINRAHHLRLGRIGNSFHALPWPSPPLLYRHAEALHIFPAKARAQEKKIQAFFSRLHTSVESCSTSHHS